MVALPFDPAIGPLTPGGPQTRNPNYFAAPQGLIGYWGFDPDCMDFTAAQALDLTTNGNSGALTSLPATALRNGQIGTALQFDGAATKINCGTTAVLNPANVSISAWINGTSFPNAYNAIVHRGNNTTFYEYYVKSTGKIAMLIGGASGGASSYDGTGTFTLSTAAWYHVVLTYDGTIGLRGYVNGALDGTGVARGAQGTISSQFNIGYDLQTAGRIFNGMIDDVRAYNRGLEPGEVLQLYQAGLAGRRDAMWALPGETEFDVVGGGSALVPWGLWQARAA